MTSNHYEVLLNFFLLFYGLVPLNFNDHKLAFWKRILFTFAISFSLFASIMDIFLYENPLNSVLRRETQGASKATALFLVNIFGDLWTAFALIWGLLLRKKLGKAARILKTVDNFICKLESGNQYQQPNWKMRLFLLFQVMAFMLRLLAVGLKIIKIPTSSGINLIIEVAYKHGIISVYYSHIAFIYHKLSLRFREVNHQLMMFKNVTDRAKIPLFGNMRQLLGEVVKDINDFFAIPVRNFRKF